MLLLQVPNDVRENAAHALAALFTLMIIAFLFYVGLWAWMLYDSIANELPGSKEKTNWTLFILLFGPFAGIVYSVGRRKQRIRENGH
jgi:hypothetical protein